VIPLAHAAHWLMTALYAGPVIVVLIAIVRNALQGRSGE
jgi:hypothetical protein